MNEQTRQWWEQTKSDFSAAQYLLKGKRYLQSSFFCQQAAEKALKTLLVKKKKKLLKVHDLILLGKQVGISSHLLPNCERLNAVYIDTRYPDTGTDRYTVAEVREDLKSCRRIVQWVRSRI